MKKTIFLGLIVVLSVFFVNQLSYAQTDFLNSNKNLQQSSTISQNGAVSTLDNAPRLIMGKSDNTGVDASSIAISKKIDKKDYFSKVVSIVLYLIMGVVFTIVLGLFSFLLIKIFKLLHSYVTSQGFKSYSIKLRTILHPRRFQFDIITNRLKKCAG